MGTKRPAVDLTSMALRPYVPSPTCLKFHMDNSRVRGIRGPFGSGKSTACCMEILSRAVEQTPFRGVRKSRWLALRNSYPELVETTLKTWTSWVPTAIAPVRESVPMQSRLECQLTDGTRLELTVLFISFDHPDDIRKLKSLEVTGAWLNEASELDEEALTAVSARVGRFPSTDEGGPSWHGIIMDTNSPDDSSWWYRLAEIDKPQGYRFFDQPAALVEVAPRETAVTSPLDVGAGVTYLPNDGTHGLPPAENVDHLPGGFQYYLDLVTAKSRSWVSVYILNQYGSTRSGKVVYPEYLDAIHRSPKPLTSSPGLVLYVGWDFGLSVSCVFAQLTVRGQLKLLRELSGEDVGVQRFVRDYFKPCITQHYPNYQLVMTGDPAGAQRSQTTEQTCYGILAEEGFQVTAAATNEFAARREAVVWFLTHLSSDGSAFLLDPSCEVLRKGFLRAYAYRKMQSTASQTYALRPEKNEYSHLQDALQYLCLLLRAGGYAYEKETVRLPRWGQREFPVTVADNLVWL